MCMLALKPSIYMPQSGNHRGEGLGKELVGRRGTPKEGEVEHVLWRDKEEIGIGLNRKDERRKGRSVGRDN